MEIYFIRHGETVYNKLKKYQGQWEIPLSDEGRAKLKPADFSPKKVYVSPLGRAVETAKILFPHAELVPVPGLMEMCFGDFEGQSYEDMEHDPVYLEWISHDALGRCPNGESKGEFTLRVSAAFDEVIAEALKTPDEPLVMVAHGGTQMAAMETFAVPHFDYYHWCAPNGCGYRMHITAEDWARDHTLPMDGHICFTWEEQEW